MKKIVVLSLAAVASLGLAACSKEEPAASNETEVTNAADVNATVEEAVADVNATADNAVADINATVENATNAVENATNAQ